MENTIPNIKQSALEYFVYTIRDRRERRKLLRFAQKHYTPSENFIWGPPRKAQPEGSKAQKPPGPPTAGQHGQMSMHKKPKDSKNASSAAHGISKAAEDKKVASKESEETDKPSEEPGSEAAQPGDPGQDEVANNSSPRAEKTVTHPEEQKESASPSEKDEASDTRNQDGGSPGDAGSHDDAALP